MFPLFASAAAEGAADLSQALQGLTPEESLAAGAILGMSAGVVIAFGIVYFILRVIADWRIFTKAGRAGWKSLIPILSEYEEFDLCWNGSLGLAYGIGMLFIQYVNTKSASASSLLSVLAAAVGIACLVLGFRQSLKLSRAFGKGTGFGVGLFLLGPIFRLVLGFGGACYVGKPEA